MGFFSTLSSRVDLLQDKLIDGKGLFTPVRVPIVDYAPEQYVPPAPPPAPPPLEPTAPLPWYDLPPRFDGGDPVEFPVDPVIPRSSDLPATISDPLRAPMIVPDRPGGELPTFVPTAPPPATPAVQQPPPSTCFDCPAASPAAVPVHAVAPVTQPIAAAPGAPPILLQQAVPAANPWPLIAALLAAVLILRGR